MHSISGKTALITGGASGIGKLMGRLLLQKGLGKLVIWDRDAVMLAITLQEFLEQNFNVQTSCIDITSLKDIVTAADDLKKNNIQIDILINNAGIITGKYFI